MPAEQYVLHTQLALSEASAMFILYHYVSLFLPYSGFFLLTVTVLKNKLCIFAPNKNYLYLLGFTLAERSCILNTLAIRIAYYT